MKKLSLLFMGFLLITGIAFAGGTQEVPKVTTQSASEAKSADPPVTDKVNLDKTYLVVYGNANGDNYLDSEDVDLIQDILDGNTTWDKTKNPFADTNADGSITQADLELLNKFLNKEEATMYYMDWNLEVDSINYPLTGNVAVTQVSSVYIGQIVGYYEDITHINRPASWFSGNLRTDMFPGLIDKVKSTGNYDLNIEAVVASGVNIVFGAISSLDDNTRATLKSYGIQGIALPVMKNMNGLDWNTSIVTLGVMMQKQNNTAGYIEYLGSLEDRIDTIADKSGKYSFIDVFGPVSSDATTVSIETVGDAGITYGDVVNMMTFPMEPIFTAEGDGYTKVELESILTHDPDVILVLAFGTFTESDTAESLAEAFGTADAFRGTTAYENKNIYFASWNIYGSVLGLPCMLYLASMIWPETFSEEDGIEMAQEFFDEFTLLNKDVTKVPGLLPSRMDG